MAKEKIAGRILKYRESVRDEERKTSNSNYYNISLIMASTSTK
jgi:hypothetical protein